MNKYAFNRYLNEIIAKDEPALNLILAQRTEKLFFRKNQIIYAKGKIPTQLLYLERGNAIALSHPKPNRQVLRFWVADQLICPDGFFNNLPAAQSIIALDDCIVNALSYDKLLNFLIDFPEGYKIINAILTNEIKLVELLLKSLVQNKSVQQHEAFLEALAISFDE
jgi:CRP-like cAMP-binding protein